MENKVKVVKEKVAKAEKVVKANDEKAISIVLIETNGTIKTLKTKELSIIIFSVKYFHHYFLD